MYGVWMCTALVVGNIIGAGIFLLPTSLAPDGLEVLCWAGWSPWLACTFCYISFADFARSFPEDDAP